MFLILVIYFIAKYFRALAGAHGKSKTLFGFLGLLTFYIGGMFVSLPVYIVLFIFFPQTTERFSAHDDSFIAFICGFVACYIVYYIFQKKWIQRKFKPADAKTISYNL